MQVHFPAGPLDGDGRLERVDGAFARIAGHGADELVGRSLFSLIDDQEVLASPRLWEGLREGGIDSVEQPVRLRRKEGSLADVVLHLAPVSDRPGGRAAWVCQIHDVSVQREAERALEAERRLTEQVADAVPGVLYVYDVDARGMVFVNREITRAIGYSPEELTARLADPMSELMHPDDHAGYAANLAQVSRLADGEVAVFDSRARHADGTWHWYRTHDRVFARHPDGRVARLIGAAIDVTEEKEAQERLRSERDLSDHIVESLPGIFYLVDATGRILRWNECLLDATGYTAEEVAAMAVPAFFRDADRARVEERMRTALETGHADAEMDLLDRSGRPTAYYFTGRRIELDGRTCILGTGTDISARRDAERRLEASEARYRSLAENSAVGIWQIDEAGYTVYANPAMCRMLEIEGPDALDREIYHPFFTDESLQTMAREHGKRAGGVASEYEVDLVGAQGTRRRVLVSGAPLRGADGGLLGLIGTFLDITDRRELETRLQRVQKLESVGQLAAGVAHDFNNLLTVIQGHADLLRDLDAVRHEHADALDQIVAATERAAGLTRQLLLFSRRQRMQPRTVDLGDLVADLFRMLDRVLGEPVALQIERAADPTPVLGDPGMLEQVVTNLAVNAPDAMPDGGTLRIETAPCDVSEREASRDPEARPGAFVRHTVADTGTGMAPEVLARIFEPFFTTKDVGHGTGLGLSTAYGIVRQHEGWIEVDSRPGRGTTFRVFLPRAVRAAADGEERPAAGLPGGRETILVVGDEPAVRRLAERILALHGYTVLCAANGPDALALWDDHLEAIDLLLTDMVMPEGMTGQSLAARLRADRPDLEVVYMGGYTADWPVTGARAGPVDGFLEKPFQSAALLDAVRVRLDEGDDGDERG